MMKNNRMRLSQFAISLAIALTAAPAFAQNTTSAIGGRITSTDGKAVAGAQVTIMHTESGSVSNAVTDADGRYSARGLRAGGPYLITITKDGRSEKRDGVFLTLAETAALDVKLSTGTQAIDTIVVTGQAGGSDKFSNTAMGAGTSISRDQLDGFASIQRNLQDYARTDPRLAQTDKERGEISVSGQNTRFNNITIDSQSITDSFGLEANNLPTLKQPISIDAIQSVQVNISNYDVTQKGYTGANINAVTKSGTNDLKGSVYYVYRDDKFVGQRYDRATNTYSDASGFKESTKGITLGGPLIKDKLFFFVSYEDFLSSKSASVGTAQLLGPLESSAPTKIGITTTAIEGARSVASSRYGIDIGKFDTSDSAVRVRDTLLKVDWNIAPGHRASMRYDKTEQQEPFYPNFFSTPSTALALTSDYYKALKAVETTVVQWFADWTPNFSTEAKLSLRDYDQAFKNAADLPLMQLSFIGAFPPNTPASVTSNGGTRNLNFGTERSRHTNDLATRTIDGYLGANWSHGTHEAKFGTDFSKNDIYDAFFQDTKGNYNFRCINSTATFTYTFGAINCATASAALVEQAVLENFSRGRPFQYTIQAPLAGSTFQDAAAFMSLKSYGTFLQDTWSVNSNLTLTAGVRLDVTAVAQSPRANAAAAVAAVPGNATTGARATGGFGLDNTTSIDGLKLVQPRFGFNYTFDSKRPMQVRGGFGLFQGAAANVWLINPYQNTGVSTRIIGCGGNFAACPVTDGTFSPNSATQPTSFTGSQPAANVDFLQSGFKQPAVWKANLGFEMELPWWGVVASAEYLNTKNKSGIYYQHLNLGDPTRAGPDGRQMFYTPQGYNSACWTATGGTITNGACTGFRTRALNNSAFNNVLVAKNTSEGGGSAATISISRPLTKDWGWSLAYTYTQAKEVSGLTSSVSNSNWQGRSIFNPNENTNENSVYLIKDRVSGTLNWQHNFFGKNKTQIGIFYEGRTGKPYSWTYSNDLNGDGIGGNDLMYIPKAPGSGDVVFAGDTATNHPNEDRFWAIVNANPGLSRNAGGVVKRNENFSPWTNSIDMRISQQLPGFEPKHKATFTFDILNFGNLLNKKWGRIDEILFNSFGGQPRSFVNFAGLDPQGKYIYIVNSKVGDFTTRQARGESQWALQATLKYEF